MHKAQSQRLRFLSVAAVPLLVSLVLPARADLISPHVNASGKVYSKEPPNSAMYGTGMVGRLAEASALRYEGDQLLVDGKYEEAIPKLAKCVQLDPGCALGHVLYARAITTKLYESEDAIDEKLLRKAITEWKMIWRHDADQLEQEEARMQARKLMKIAKNLEKKRQDAAKEMLAEKKTDKERMPASDINEIDDE